MDLNIPIKNTDKSSYEEYNDDLEQLPVILSNHVESSLCFKDDESNNVSLSCKKNSMKI